MGACYSNNKSHNAEFDEKENKDEYINNLSQDTKNSIAATHLFATIWHNYFSDEENKCEYMSCNNSDSFDVLDYILIRGGCCRDVLWNKDFNDIDATVNTRELNKLHLLHLKKYHNTKESQINSHCIFWLHYAKKYEKNKTKNETRQTFCSDTTGQKIMQSDYMLNAKFLKNILENDERVNGKLSVAKGRRVWNIRIIDTLMYNGCNLNGFDFDFLDIKHDIFKNKKQMNKIHSKHILQREKTRNMLSLNINNNNLQISNVINQNTYRAMYSIRVHSQLKMFEDKHEFNVKSIDLPIYPLVFVEMSKLTDLTMNSIIIHMSDVIRNHADHKISTQVDFDWRSKVKNSSPQIDGIKDCQNRHIKVYGQSIKDMLHFFQAEDPKVHIWRVCKMWLKLNGTKGMVTIDENLINGTIEMLPKWFNIQLLSDEEYCKDIADRFINAYAQKGKYDLRFEFLDMIGFNKMCIDMMQNVSNYRKYVYEFIQNIQDNETKMEIKTIMQQYGYYIGVIKDAELFSNDRFQ